MKNNSFEEVILNPQPFDVKKDHTNIINGLNLPIWSANLTCPYCKEHMDLTCVRAISLKTNPRNIGDVCVEFLCNKCSVGNTFYFKREAKDISDFINLINGSTLPTTNPITEEDMYQSNYHNTIEIAIQNSNKTE